jgi:predicted ribosome quality control (RQC) complex YloA/Tae2 family protein
MHILSALEYSYLAQELSRSLVGKHFNRIRKLGEKTYRMKIGTEEVLCELGVRANLTRYIEPSEGGDKFADKLEKELDNAKLRAVKQVSGDRILAFEFDKGTLIFEMFGGGNAILVRDGVAIAAHRYESWSDREIKAGGPYKPPKTSPSQKLELGEKYVIVSMMKLPLGKEYALEALKRAGIDEKTPGNSLTIGQAEALESAIKQMMDAAKPIGFYKDGKLAEFSLASLSKMSGFEPRPFASLSEAADEYYANAEKPDPLLEKLNDRLEKQNERLSSLIEEEKALKETGDLVYARYAEVEKIIALAKKDDRPALDALGVKIDKKEKTAEADI